MEIALGGKSAHIQRTGVHIEDNQSSAMMPARSCLDVPSASSDLTSKSIETEGSPASILAIRDWLELRSLANSTCVNFFANLRFLRFSASISFRSI